MSLFSWTDSATIVRDERVELGDGGWEDDTVVRSGEGRPVQEYIYGSGGNRLGTSTS